MKKLIITIICIAGILPAFGQSLTFSNQTIIVAPENLTVESVEFQPSEIVTNMVVTWEDVIVVSTNGWMDGGEVVTNVMQQQAFEEVVSTNASAWTCNVVFTLPKGYLWGLNGWPVTIERFKVLLEIPVDPAVVSATFGPAAAGLEFAASNGEYVPAGIVRDAFLSFSAAVLAGGN